MKWIPRLLFGLLIINGCAASPREQLPTGAALRRHTFVLTERRPVNKGWGVRLVAVEADGTVVIRRRGQELRAAPGEPFWEGLFALRAQASDPSDQRAVFAYVLCESF